MQFGRQLYTFSEQKQANKMATVCADVMLYNKDYNVTEILTVSITATVTPITAQGEIKNWPIIFVVLFDNLIPHKINIICTGETDYIIEGPTSRTFNTSNPSVQKCISIEIIDDKLPEGSETMQLHIAVLLDDYDIIAEDTTTIDITDDFGECIITMVYSLHFIIIEYYFIVTGFAEVPTSKTAVLNSNNVSFTCTSDNDSFTEIEWSINGETVRNGQYANVVRPQTLSSLSSTLHLQPVLEYNGAAVVCTLIAASNYSVANSVSDPACLKLECKLVKASI